MKNKLLSLVLLLLPLTPLAAYNIADLNLTTGVEEYRLPNGLRVILKEEDSVPLTGVAVSYNVGFRNDITNHTGLTHLLEHMMFRATSNYIDGALSKAMDELGAQNNAYTTYGRTVYHEILPAANLEQALSIEAERMVNSLLEPAAFEKEKNVVLSELTAHEGNPEVKLSRALYEQTFGTHPFTYRYGLLSDMSNANRDFVYNKVYRKYYTPNNATLLIIGNMDKKKVKAWVNQYFGGIKSDPTFKPQGAIPLKWNMKADVKMEGVASEDFGTIMYKLPAQDLKDPDFIALSFINWAGILGNFYYWPTQDGGIGFADYNAQPDYPAETIDPQYIRDNFTFFQERLLNQERMDYDSISSIMSTLAWLDSIGSYKDYTTLVKAFAALQPDDVIRVIQKYLTRENSVKGFFKAVTRDKNARPGSSQVNQESHGGNIDYSELEDFTPEQLRLEQDKFQANVTKTLDILDKYLDEVKSVTLSNGLTLIYRPFSLNDKVSILVGVHSGQIYQKKPFQAALTHSFVFEGGPQILLKNELTRKGGRFSASIDFNYSKFSLDIPKEEFSTALQLTALAMRDRKFIPLLLEEKKATMLKILDLKKLDPSSVSVSREALYRTMLGKKGAGLDYQAQPADVLSIQLSDLEAFYKAQYQPSQITIAVVGKVDFETVKAEVTRLFGDWKNTTTPFTQAAPEIPKANSVKKVHVVNSMQSVVRMAGPSVDYSDATNYTVFQLANMIFGGGGMTSQLMRVIRDKEGLTYGIYTFPYIYGSWSLLGLYMQNAPADVKKATGIFFQELDRYTQNGPTDMEVVKFKAQAINNTLFQYENAGSIADTLLSYQMRRGRFDYDRQYIQILKTMTSETVREVTRKFMPRKFFIIEAGN